MNLFAPPLTQGAVDVVLHPGATVVNKGPVKVVFGVPFPRGFLTDAARIRVGESNGTEIPSASQELAPWRSLSANGTTASTRAVLVYIEYSFTSTSPVAVKLQWGVPRTRSLVGALPAPSTLWTSMANGHSPGEYPTSDNIREPAVYATLPAAWLGQTLLHGPAQAAGQNSTFAWWDTAMPGFASTAVNEVAATVLPENLISYATDAEPWLFDRAMTLFNLYIRTGDVHWLRHAHRAAQWYAMRVDANGIFTLKGDDDLKYSYGASLLTDFFLTGDSSLAAPIQRVAQAGERLWQTNYSRTQHFWTERHHAYALRAALAAYQLTGNAAQGKRARDLVGLTANMSNNAAHCPLHTMEQHEGDASNELICSPWMSALLSDAVMDYYIVSEDPSALNWLAGMGDYVRDHGIYDASFVHPELKDRWVPWYLAGVTYKNDDNNPGWGDMEHACDVGAMTARAAWAKRQLGQSDAATVQQAAQRLMDTCQYVLNDWHRNTRTLAEWRLSPPRKFNWWFGGALGYDWFFTR